jgi:hypothetical protein
MTRVALIAGLIWMGLALGGRSALAATNAPVDPPPLPSPPVDFNHLPWANGEALTYQVSWGSFQAAQGVFISRDKGDHWEFELKLASRGFVDDFYPFTGFFWSTVSKPIWHSIEYSEYRFEPRKTVRERTRIDYTKELGTRENWSVGQTKTFPITEDVDDVGSMLYHLRAIPWKIGERRTLFVYENGSEKQGNVTCQARETRAFGIWPSQPVLRIVALPGKGTHHRGGLTLWQTDDARRLPLHAELDFRYGSFSIDLVKIDKEAVPSH